MKTATHIALALALAAASAPLTTPRALAETRAAEAPDTKPSMTMGEFRRWQRNWDRRLLDMHETDAEQYA